MAKIKNASQWGSAKARERYPCGGMVKKAVGGPALGGGRGPFGEKSEEEFIKNSERSKRQKITDPMGGYAGDSAASAASREEKRDVGGKVEPLRIPLTDIHDRIQRLKGAGILNQEAATDFAAARMKRLGFDPEKYVGRPARYKSGGKRK